MADPPPLRLSENNNEPSLDSSYVHKKFKKVAAFFESSVSLPPDDSSDGGVKQRKRSSNSFSFETGGQEDIRHAFAGSSRTPYDSEPPKYIDTASDTVDSKNNGQRVPERGIKFGIRDIIDEAAPSTKWDANLTRDDTFVDSHRKRCISEGPMMHPVLVRPKIQRFDNFQGESSAIKQLLLQNSNPVHLETQREAVRRPVSDFSINNLMKPSQSAIQNSVTNVRTFQPSSVFQPPGDKVRKQCPNKLDNRVVCANSVAAPLGSSMSFSTPNSISGRMYSSAAAPALHNFEGLRQPPQAVVDLSARRKEVMSRGLPLVSNFQSVAMPSPKDEKNKVRKDDSPRVVRELKFHNYTVDSVPYLISPTKSRAFIPEKTKESDVVSTSRDSEEVKKFSRPTSLSLKPGSFQRKKVCMSGVDHTLGIPRFQDGGHVLISPDTPRPSKAYNQTFVNGYSYTTLGLKCSTRVYFCCLSKPQPMYVVQETDPKLSMYSQWQIRPSAIDLSQPGLVPTQFLSSYDSRQRQSAFTLANSKNILEVIVTPSAKVKPKLDIASHQQEAESKTSQIVEPATPESSCSNVDPEEVDNTPLDMTKKTPAKETVCQQQPVSAAGAQTECSSSDGEGDRERMVSSPFQSLDDKKEDELDLGNDADDDVSVKAEVDEESGDTTNDKVDNLEDPCSSKSDPDGFDLFDSEGSPESLVRRITDNIRNGKKTIGRGPSPLFNVCDGEGRSTCHFCQKVFSKASQLRLHINIHYIERPFKCVECGVSFRNKGHLKKHLQSAIHLSKVNKNGTFGIPSEENPRPFKCSDCLVAFRIHGHLAKHLRSKSHIMKLECNGKLPFGTYAEIERSGINVNEIDTTDCQNTLESLKALIVQRFGRLQRERRVDWEENTSNS